MAANKLFTLAFNNVNGTITLSSLRNANFQIASGSMTIAGASSITGLSFGATSFSISGAGNANVVLPMSQAGTASLQVGGNLSSGTVTATWSGQSGGPVVLTPGATITIPASEPDFQADDEPFDPGEPTP